jgi:peptidoglycan-N-acetylglucosamine deacetylase
MTMPLFKQYWNLPLAIKWFLLMLAAAGVFVFLNPAMWLWSLSIIFIFHFLLRIVGLLPRSKLLGPNITHLPLEAERRGEVAITIDDGPDPEVTPQVLEILDRYQAKATFFCIGRRAEQHPELCREIVRRGHAIENHSQSHYWYFSLLDPWRTHREVQQAQLTLSKVCGETPRFFRPTAGLRNLVLQPILAHCNLRLCSWNKRGFDTRMSDTNKVLASLTRNLKEGDIMLLHDGHAAVTAKGNPVIIEVLPLLLERLSQAGLRSVTLRSAIP